MMNIGINKVVSEILINFVSVFSLGDMLNNFI